MLLFFSLSIISLIHMKPLPSDFEQEISVLLGKRTQQMDCTDVNGSTRKKMVIIALFVTTVLLAASIAVLLSLQHQQILKDRVKVVVAAAAANNQVAARDYYSSLPSYAHAVSPYANLIRFQSYTLANNNNRVFVMGDVHGCLDEMNRLLENVQFQPTTDTLILAGDLVYRGNNSVGVLQRARELGALCVRGNHDDKVIRFKSFEQQHGTAAMMVDLQALMPEGQVADPLKFKNKHATLARYIVYVIYRIKYTELICWIH